jgi:hypothetical protein
MTDLWTQRTVTKKDDKSHGGIMLFGTNWGGGGAPGRAGPD